MQSKSNLTLPPSKMQRRPANKAGNITPLVQSWLQHLAPTEHNQWLEKDKLLESFNAQQLVPVSQRQFTSCSLHKLMSEVTVNVKVKKWRNTCYRENGYSKFLFLYCIYDHINNILLFPDDQTLYQMMNVLEPEASQEEEEPVPQQTPPPDSDPPPAPEPPITVDCQAIQLLLQCWENTTKSPLANQYITTLFNLDFECWPCPDTWPLAQITSPGQTIPVHDEKQGACESLKWQCIFSAQAGYETLGKGDKLTLAEAISWCEAYYSGHQKALAGHTIMTWYQAHLKPELQAIDYVDVFTPKNRKKRCCYISSIQRQFPDFLHKLY